jgi:RNA polymerase sigma-70 factor, ECF subfamily
VTMPLAPTAGSLEAVDSARSHEIGLAERHRWGDAEAFEEIYREHSEMVYNLALRLAGDRERAADLSQEVFLRIHRHLGKFRGRSSLKTWIYRVTVNHCRSRLSRRRLLTLSIDAAAGSGSGGAERGDVREPPIVLTDPSRDPEERAMAGDAEKILQAALAELPVVFREAVVLRDLEDLTYDEIAEVLGARIGTVRSRIARGRGMLRDVLTRGPRDRANDRVSDHEEATP